jgi:hypothetical protein
VSDGSAGSRAATRSRSGLRTFALVLLVVVAVAAVAVGWLTWRGLAAKQHLADADARTEVVRAALLDGRTEEATAAVADVRDDTARARDLTSDPIWRAAGALPLVGGNARAVTTTTAAVDRVAQDVLPVLVEQSDALDPAALRGADGRIDLARIAAAAEPLAAAHASAQAAADDARAVDTEGLPSSLRDAVVRAQDGLDELAEMTGNASDAATLLPPMLGADGPRRYFLGLQTNAEARATGGLVGAYGVLEADQGRLRVRALGPRTDLDVDNRAKPTLDLGADYAAQYGDDPGWWQNTNLSPHFPYAAQLWLEMYERQTGTRLDGAIATDPVAMSHMLGAIGDVRLGDGSVVSQDDAARLTMRDVYARIPDDDARRDEYLQEVARAVVDGLLSGGGDAADLARALGRSAGERRLFVYSTVAAEQAALENQPIAGALTSGPGPHVGVFVNNGSGSKLDYYLEQSVEYALGACTGADRRSSTVTVTLRNAAPRSGLPPYVTIRLDADRDDGRAVGTNLDLVSVHLPEGAVITGARLDGAPLPLSSQRELGHSVVGWEALLEPGQRQVVVLDLTEPRSDAEPKLQVQALARPALATVTESDCD